MKKPNPNVPNWIPVFRGTRLWDDLEDKRVAVAFAENGRRTVTSYGTLDASNMTRGKSSLRRLR